MPNQPVEERICAYRSCPQAVVTDAPSMLLDTIPRNKSLLCPQHERQVDADLTWLERNLDDLEHYKLNRAYGHKTGGGGTSGTAPLPLRVSLADLLYADDDAGYPGLQGVLHEWCRSMSINLPPNAEITRMVTRIHTHPRLCEHKATPVYAELVHGMVRRLGRFLSDTDGETVLYGECPAIGCDGTLTAFPGGDVAECPKCGLSMPVVLIHAERIKRLLTADVTMSRDKLLKTAKTCGLRIKPGTLRSWISRKNLEPAGTNEQGEPVYRFGDLYRLASGLKTTPDLWDIMSIHTKGDNQ